MTPATRRASAALLAALAGACHRDPPPGAVTSEPAPPAASTSSPSAPPPSPPEPSLAPATSAATPPASAAPAPASAPPPHEVDPQNRVKPALASDDLTTRASHLFDAVKNDDPSVGADFFFPRAPFIPLKDVANAGGYWDQLFREYQKDIHDLHRKHRAVLEGATFSSFALGSTPGWVKPGEEYNKIGYYRTFNGKLAFKSPDGAEHHLEVKVIISWDNGWYVTHLSPFKQH